ncbi:MAG: DUF11 domain-containing protein, partial [Caldilineaceae bacterium]|nr:DUF11 domain-containing protein [Caldilineaceae bacterium]
VTVQSGDSIAGRDFFDALPATLSGTVYHDRNGNGQFDSGEPGIPGVQITLSNGVTTTTDANGAYVFTVMPGIYTITETNLNGFVSTGDVQGDNDDIIANITLQSGQVISARDFFDARPATISGTVYHDRNANGQYENGEPGIQGVQLTLSNGLTATTNAGGVYTFTVLPGIYTIAETNLAGFTSTGDVQGNNDDTIANIVVLSGDSVAGQNFFDAQLASDIGLAKALRSVTNNVDGTYTVAFTLTVKNLGNVALNNLIITDDVTAQFSSMAPAGFHASNGSLTANPGWDGTANSNVVAANQSLAVGQTGNVIITFTVARGATASAENTATATATGPNGAIISDVSHNGTDPDPDGNGTANNLGENVPTYVPFTAFDLALRMTPGAGNGLGLRAGDPLTFTLTVFNQGTITATNIALVDYLPAGFTLHSLNGSSWAPGPNNTATLTLSNIQLAPQASATVNIVLTTAQAPGASVSNVAEIAGATDSQGNPVQDVDSTFDSANNETNVKDDVIDEYGKAGGDEDDHDIALVTIGRFDLALRLRVAEGQAAAVDVNQDIAFVVEIFNQGDMVAQNMTIVDYLPSGFTLSPQDANGWVARDGEAVLTIPGPLAPGQSVQVPIVLRAGATTGSLTNAAEIMQVLHTTGVPMTDWDSTADRINGNDRTVDDVIDNTGDDEDDYDIAVVEVVCFDLALRKQLSPEQSATPAPGSDVRFRITVMNQGTVAATDIVVVDYVPDGFTLSANDGNGWQVVNGAYQMIIPGPLLPEHEISVEIVLTLGPNRNGTMTNTAEIVQARDNTGAVRADVDSLPNDDPFDDMPDEDDRGDANITIHSPTAISLSTLSGYSRGGAIFIQWETALELNTFGYHIYRSLDGTIGGAVRVSPTMIRAQGTSGGSYLFEDTNVEPGVTYYYWLAEVEYTAAGDPVETYYGPVTVKADLGAHQEETDNGIVLFLPIVSK